MSSEGVVILIVAIFSLVMLAIFAGIAFIVYRAFRLLRDTQEQIKSILKKVEAIAGTAQDTTAEVGKSVKGVTEIWSQALRAPVVQSRVGFAGLRRFIEVLLAKQD
jgi:hypothetical protein